MLNKLDAFQIRGLRAILNIEHSYKSHVSNEEIIEKANIAMNKGENLHLNWQQFLQCF